MKFLKMRLFAWATVLSFVLALAVAPVAAQSSGSGDDSKGTDTGSAKETRQGSVTAAGDSSSTKKSKKRRKHRKNLSGASTPTASSASAASSSSSASGSAASTPTPSVAPSAAAKPAGAVKAPAASTPEIGAARASGKVWVNLESGVYHKGGRWYGHTKNGKFMSEDEATKAGYRASEKD
jgi:hypothetical protein